MTSAFIEYSTDTQVKLRRYFIRMGLPIPKLSDVRYTTDRGRLCFLTDYGCTIRTTRDNRHIQKQHPHFLRPLFARQANNVRMEIYPGIVTPAPGLDVDGFRHHLNKHHDIFINGRDAHKSNFGFLPGTQFPVMLDVDRRFVAAHFDTAAIELSKSVHELWPLLPSRELNIDLDAGDPQKQLFGDLAAEFALAWPAENDVPNPSLMAKAWASCLDAKENGLLAAPWVEFNDRRQLREKAEQYGQKIAQRPPAEYVPFA